MSEASRSAAAREVAAEIEAPPAGALLNAVADVLVVVDRAGGVLYVNLAAEQFFSASSANLCGQALADLLPADSPLFSLIEQVFTDGHAVSEYGVSLDTPRIGLRFATLQVAPVPDREDTVVISIHEQSMARKIDRQLVHRNAARAVTAMGAMLAHEVKNPLSGIRGAAQLLEQNASGQDRVLTRLIRDETDRICALVDRMEVFADKPPAQRQAVNVHEVLGRVRQVAEAGFARHITFHERYDPSLPPVLGIRDELIQVLLNLVKNAAEAVPERDGEIVLATAYRHGVRLAAAGSASRVHLPLEISVEDNGEGIPEDLRPHLFDPFVTTKANGTGLGLALVAKIIDDHGGVVEFESEPRRTIFRIMLPTTDLATEPIAGPIEKEDTR